MRRLKLFICVAVTVILDISVAKYMTIFGAAPMLTYAFMVCMAFFEKEIASSLVVGALCGLIFGAYDNCSLELTFIFYGLSAVLASSYSKQSHNKLFGIIALTVTATALMKLILYVVIYGEAMSLGGMLRYVVPQVIYNSVIAAVFYPITKKLINKLN